MAEQPPYVVSVAYHRPNRAKAVYQQLEELLVDQPVDLSAYNLELNGQPDYDVVTFEAWRPTTTWQAGIKRIRLGEPEWHHLLTDEVAALIGEDEVHS